CGALLVTPPVSLPMTPSPLFTPAQTATGSAATAPGAEERFFAPATFTPIAAPHADQQVAEKRGAPVVQILVVLVVVACAAAAYATLRHGPGGAPKTPVVLAPVDEPGPPNLADAVRIQPQTARQRALLTVGQPSAGANGAPH